MLYGLVIDMGDSLLTIDDGKQGFEGDRCDRRAIYPGQSMDFLLFLSVYCQPMPGKDPTLYNLLQPVRSSLDYDILLFLKQSLDRRKSCDIVPNAPELLSQTVRREAVHLMYHANIARIFKDL